MSLLAPRVLPDLKGPRAHRVPSAIRVLRTSKVPRLALLAHRGSVTILRTWRAGVAPVVLARARARALLRSASCRTRPRVGSPRDRNSRPWATVHGTLISSSLALVVTRVLQVLRVLQVPQVLQVLRAPRALPVKAASRQTRPQATKGRHRSRLRLGRLPTRSP
jgi:hypothetical protein